jgi:ribosomal protein L25 (general stress protein Ctc)
LQSFEVGVLHAQTRGEADMGSRASQRLRAQHKIPSMLYGLDEAGNSERIFLTIDEELLHTELRIRGPSFLNTLYELHINGVKTDFKVLPRDLAMHPSM